MTVVAFASVTGAPGVTTTALAATLHWPEQALLIEADTSVTTDLMVGYFRGQLAHTQGLTGLLEHPGEIPAGALLDQAVKLTPEPWPQAVSGFASIAAGQSAINIWKNLPGAFYELQRAGTDVLIDLGRLRHDDPRTPLLLEADQILILLQPTLPSVYAAYMYLTPLREQLETLGQADTIKLVTIGKGGESDRAIAKKLGTPVLTRLPSDPAAASTYSLGAGGNARNLSRAARALTNSILDAARDRRQRLHVDTVQEA